MTKLYLTILVAFCFACDTNSDKVTSDTGVAYLESDDVEMNNAIKKSRYTFARFKEALSSGDTSNYNFAIKYPFKQDYQDHNELISYEHIWLSPITIEDNKIYGIVNNQPELTRKVTLGQKIEVDQAKISDWNYTCRGKLIGGYTIRVLVNRMGSEEKADFHKSTGINFGD